MKGEGRGLDLRVATRVSYHGPDRTNQFELTISASSIFQQFLEFLINTYSEGHNCMIQLCEKKSYDDLKLETFTLTVLLSILLSSKMILHHTARGKVRIFFSRTLSKFKFLFLCI